jgi:hypothetical protein
MIEKYEKISFRVISSDSEWNELIDFCSDEIITIAHNPSIGKVLKETFGYNYYYYIIYYKNKAIGLIPFVKVGNVNVSIPHFSYGGPLFFNNIKFEDKDIEINFKKFKRYELRSFKKYSKYYNDSKVTCYLELTNSIDDQFMYFSSNLRRKIRKSYKNELSTLRGGKEYIDEFYSVYSKNMHRLGSPPLPKDFFNSLMNNYKYGDKSIYVTYYNNEVIGGAVCLSYKGFTEDCWLSTDWNYNKTYVTYQLYWEMIKDSIQLKQKYFSFGRSTFGSSLLFFKKQWGPKEKTIFFNYSWDKKFNIKSFQFLTKYWKLLPLRVTVILGRYISKKIY